nr:MAG TPA: hypothetical protein [Caudoviricetes sp.]
MLFASLIGKCAKYFFHKRIDNYIIIIQNYFCQYFLDIFVLFKT